MFAEVNRHHDAHELIKQALTSQPTNLNLRAFYTWFLIQSNLPKLAKDFVFATLKDHDKHDLYSLCAAGWIQYHQARESRDPSPKGIEERRRGFQRSAEFYEKALHLDPMCAVAAQGLAIVTAEDALGTLGGALGPITPDEAQQLRWFSSFLCPRGSHSTPCESFWSLSFSSRCCCRRASWYSHSQLSVS